MQELIGAIHSSVFTSIGYQFTSEKYLDLFLNSFGYYKRISSFDDIEDHKKIIIDLNEMKLRSSDIKNFEKQIRYDMQLIPRNRNIIVSSIVSVGSPNINDTRPCTTMHSDLVLIFSDKIRIVKDRHWNLRRSFEYSEIKSIARHNKIEDLLN